MKAFNTISVMLLGLGTLGVLAQDTPGTRPARPRADADQVSRPSPEETFKRFDVNGDGKISKEEAPPRVLQNFDRFDITKDGFITLREFRAVQSGRAGGQAAPGATPEETFKRLDVNGDGKISREEAPPRLLQNFDRFDVTKDGFITLREFRAVQSGRAGGQAAPGATPEETFKRFDVNGDGKISREEAPPRLLQNFDRFDITEDGFITLREFNAGRSSAPANPDRPQRPRASASGQ